MEKSAKKEVKRRDDGTFPAGVSGNPAGRPKGRRNEITLLKENLELQLREQGAGRMAQVLETALDLALEGDRTMIKLLLELHMTKGGSGDIKAGQERVTINIKGPERDAAREVIDITPDDGESVQEN